MIISEDVAEHILTSNARENENDLVNIAPNGSLISLQNSLPSPLLRANKKALSTSKLLQKPLIEQWLDDYWAANLSGINSVKETDKRIHILINHLLITGEEEVIG